VHVTQDAVANEQQILEFLAVEGAQGFADFLQPLGIAPIRGGDDHP